MLGFGRRRGRATSRIRTRRADRSPRLPALAPLCLASHRPPPPAPKGAPPPPAPPPGAKMSNGRGGAWALPCRPWLRSRPPARGGDDDNECLPLLSNADPTTMATRSFERRPRSLGTAREYGAGFGAGALRFVPSRALAHALSGGSRRVDPGQSARTRRVELTPL